MNLRVRIGLLALVLGVLALGAYFIFRTTEPVYGGRRLSSWLRVLESSPDAASPQWKEAAHAIRQIGSNAIPSLLQMLVVDDTKWKLQTVDWLQENMSVNLTETLANVHNRRALVGFRLLGPAAAPAVPQLERMLDRSTPQTATQVLAALGEIGSPETVPALLVALTNASPATRPQVATALGSLRSRAGAAVPALLDATRDGDPAMRASAARALAEIALLPDLVIPRLTDVLADTNALVRASAALGLSAYGTRAEAALPAMEALTHDSEEFSSRFLPRSIIRVQCELREGGIIRGPKSAKRIAFAFTGHEYDEGAETILRELAKHEGHGSFFLTGFYLANTNHTALVNRITGEGHYLGPHSEQHMLYCAWEDKRTLVTEEEFTADLLANAARISARTEERRFNRYFLPAFEHYNREIADWSRKQRWTVVNFTPGTRSNADYTGEADKNFVASQTIFDSILKKEATDPHGLNGFILLLHIGSGPGRQDKFHTRFGELLDALAGKGYEFVRLDQMLGPRYLGGGPGGFGPGPSGESSRGPRSR